MNSFGQLVGQAFNKNAGELRAVQLNVLGDINDDGTADLLDVAGLVVLIAYSAFDPAADINQDGQVSLLDVVPFVNLLTGS